MFQLYDHGSFNNVFAYLNYLKNRKYLDIMENYGQMGVDALASATPVDTGSTASSWHYEIHRSVSTSTIEWHNDNLTKTGIPIVILLQYGHGTGTGGYVQGRDFINPAIRPVFDQILDGLVEAVRSL